jgi:hypothetical protein
MPLSDRARKLLWGSAGGRCAICRHLLTEDAAAPEPAVVVGEECHIVSGKVDGPRHRPLEPSQIDAYDNLILLCPSDHEIVDKQPLHYTEATLRELKRAHERWVRDLPGPSQVRVRRDSSADAVLVYLAESGRDVLAAAGGAHAAEVATPEVANTAEADLVGDFVQTVQDWAELWDEIPMAERLKAELGLSDAIRELRDAGFVVYCGHRRDTLEGGIGLPTSWNVTMLHIFRVGDPRISSGSARDEAALPRD